ncbi:MAG: TonB-dependent receptor [Acidobacteria bacterium]|nr:TonB-dependent receptor [Acidobacteriota bacterium]MEE2609098.1 TonB-dependent receptor [Acidobacteriota bacterium]
MSFVEVTALWAVAISLSQPSQLPDRTLSGRVEDSLGGGIPGATITVECDDQVLEGMTDEEGQFAMLGLPPLQCLVAVDMEHFARVNVDVDLTENSVFDAKLTLSLAGLEAEVVVTPALGTAEQSFSVPEAVAVTTRAEIKSRPHQILPQVLREETGVLVQQTTTAQGSPFIRGFSAQRIVYLLDGVRFNTSTFRAGATQYLGWINPALVERLEVVRGPSSVQYGSDSIGGTINVLSMEPTLSSVGRRVTGVVEGVFGSADLSGNSNATVLVQDDTWAVRLGGGGRRVGELRTGRGRDSHAAVTRFLGLPSKTLYNKLPDTDFSQIGAHLAATFDAGDDASLNVFFLHEEQFGVSRHDRRLGGDGRYRSEFEPQQLDFGYIRYQKGQMGWLDGWSASLSLNRQQDGRLEQSHPKSTIERQEGRVLAVGYQVRGARVIANRHALTFGGELYDEYIAAARTFQDPVTDLLTTVRPRIPDGTRYTSSGLFLQTASEIVPGRLTLRAGIRHGYFLFRTRSVPKFNVRSQRIPVNALTFHSGTVLGLTDAMNVTFVVSRGFRAANAFDLGSIGISGNGFEITPEMANNLGGLIGDSDGADARSTGLPIADLRPESAINIEASIKLRTPRFSGSLNVFNLELRDVLQRRTAIFPSPIVGTTVAGFTVIRQDAAGRAFIKDDPRPIVTRANGDRARVIGTEADAQMQVAPGWLAAGYFSLVNGRELHDSHYLRRMPPPFGGLRIRWEPVEQSYWIEITSSLAFAQTRLSPGDVTDARIGGWRTRASIAEFFTGGATNLGLVQNGRLTATGETLEEVQARVLGGTEGIPLFVKTPGFLTFGARAAWQVHPQLALTIIVENLTDRNYRWHGSGVDAPGFNLQLNTQFTF